MTGLSAEYVRSLLHYDPKTGILTWKQRPRVHFTNDRTHAMRNARFAGKIAGRKDSKGHLQVTIDGVSYAAHRVIWLIVYGVWPDKIDHINHVRDDNRLLNMREVDAGGNARNASLRHDNSSGRVGVYWLNRIRKWVASTRKDGTLIHLGVFTSKDQAIAARAAAERELGFHENHGRAA